MNARELFGRTRRLVLHRIARAARDPIRGGLALTYDDGPHPEFTAEILDVLKAHGRVATFFVIGERAVLHPELIRRIVAEGHSLGSHSMRHPDFFSARVSAVRDDIRESIQVLESLSGARIRLFRPPHGHLTPRTAFTIRRLRLRTSLWDVNSGDWKPDATPEEIADRALRAPTGSVVLFHDTLQRTVAATRMIVRDAPAGLEFVGLSAGPRFRPAGRGDGGTQRRNRDVRSNV